MSAPYGSNQAGYGYPPQTGTYPPQGAYGYPPPTGAYPGQQPMYPPPSGQGHPSQTGGYPIQQPTYPSPSMGIGFAANDPRIQKLNQVIQKYEINPQFGQRLHALLSCEIVLLCDDSGSMNAPLQGSNQTRWDELKHVSVHKPSSSVFLSFFIFSLSASSQISVQFLIRMAWMSTS